MKIIAISGDGIGAGKCWKKGTPVLTATGDVKLVEDVVIGDLLMGPDGSARTVLGLGRGRERMYKITPSKGDSYVCNESHILTLKFRGARGPDSQYQNGRVVNISVKDYLAKSGKFKSYACLWSSPGVEFSSTVTPMYDPYWVGLWLGDGTATSATITKDEAELDEYFPVFAEAAGVQYEKSVYSGKAATHRFTTPPGKTNPLLTYTQTALRRGEEKRVPVELLRGSRDTRLAVLAGLLDTDGYLANDAYFEITTKYHGLRDDILFLARSLGFMATSTEKVGSIASTGFSAIYQRINICGDVWGIPTRIARKQAKKYDKQYNIDPLLRSFDIEDVGEDDYYGFELDGDHLFLLGDFTVGHNSTAATKLAQQTWSLAGAMRQELSLQYPAYDWFNKSQAYKSSTIIHEYGDGRQTMRAVLLEYGQQKCWEDACYWIKLLCDRLEGARGIFNGVHTIAIDDIRKVCEIQHLRQHSRCEVLHVHIANPEAVYEAEFQNEELSKLADYVIQWSKK